MTVPDPGTIDRETGLAIAQDLAGRAIWWGGLCAFAGATAPDRLGGRARQAVLGGDLYEGSAGVARLLAHAARLCGDATLRRTALGAARHGLARTEGWSLHSGRLGAGLVALEVAQALDAPELVPEAVESVERASEAAVASAASAPADLLGGVAGVVHGLIEALPYDLDGGWRARAFELGRALLAAAMAGPTGISWPLAPGRSDHLCGLGHGAAGVALALTRLASLAPAEPAWAEAAAAARGFERGWFSPAHGSWADLRAEAMGAAGPQHPHFWCHGSVGVGQERVGAIAAGLADTLCRADAAAALAGMTAEAERIIARPAGPGAGDLASACLCHGLGGMVDLLGEAWAIDRDDATLALMRRITAFIRNDAGPERRWRSGVPGGGQAPGLMLGDAGIAWAHLRAWNPDALPVGWTPRILPLSG